MQKITSFFVAGLKFGDYKKIVGLKSGLPVRLTAEPLNPYDKNAIKVLVIVDTLTYKLGYVPKEQTYQLHNYRVKRVPIKATLLSYNRGFPEHKAALVLVESEGLLEDNSAVDFINIE